MDELGIRENSWQDVAPAHVALEVRAYLNDSILDRWVGCESVNSAASMSWPLRNPDYSTCDNSLWGYVKNFF